MKIVQDAPILAMIMIDEMTILMILSEEYVPVYKAMRWTNVLRTGGARYPLAVVATRAAGSPSAGTAPFSALTSEPPS